MEVLQFLNYLKANSSESGDRATEKVSTSALGLEPELDEGDDSLFELKISSADSPSDSISKRKILPVEPFPKSPFKVQMFKRSKSVTRASHGFESSPNVGRFYSSRFPDSNNEEEKPWRLLKYLKVIRPLYVRMTRKPAELHHVGVACPSPSSSPMVEPKRDTRQNVIRVVCKRLTTSKSAPATCAPMTTKNDDSLQLHNDGIQGAILYCKNSFNSSKDVPATVQFGTQT